MPVNSDVLGAPLDVRDAVRVPHTALRQRSKPQQMLAWIEHAVDLVFSSRREFERVAAEPTWFVPVVALCVMRFAGMMTFFSPDAAVSKLVLTFTLASIPAVLSLAVITVALFVGATMLNSGARAGQVLAVTVRVLCLVEFLNLAIAIVVRTFGVAFKATEAVPRLANLTWFTDASNHVAFRIAQGMDATTLLGIALLSIGLSATSERLRGGRATLIVASLWLLYFGVTVGIKVALT